ncbi:DoxX family protein [Colwelliaceae bacterium 6471]
MNTLQTFAAPSGRIFLALIFLMSGINKITQYSGTQGYMDAIGVPGALLPLVIMTEVLGGLAIIFGWKAKWAALLLAGFSILSAILFHADFANQAEMINFMKNIAIAGGFLMIFVHGPGVYALDNRKFSK